MIIAYLIDDTQALRACSLTCRSWYAAAAPHLHRTFVFREGDNGRLGPLSKRHALGLLPFAKEILVLQPRTKPRWFLPRSFSNQDLQYFSAFTNVQSLTIQGLDIHSFIPGIERYFVRFSPTVRSITLDTPHCTPRQLSHFFSLFPNLDDIEVRSLAHLRSLIPDDAFVPSYTPKLQGKLTLSSFTAVHTWEDLATSCGLRFRCMHLYDISKCAPILLSACAETLETLRIEPDREIGKGSRPVRSRIGANRV